MSVTPKLQAHIRITKRACEMHMAAISPRVFDCGRLGWGVRTCISSKFPGCTNVADPKATLIYFKNSFYVSNGFICQISFRK